MSKHVLNRLSARSVDTIAKAGKHADGGGLYLVVEASGKRRWVLLYTHHGRRREMGLGVAGRGGVSLAVARDLAAQARASLALGADPIEARRKAEREAKRIPTFGEFADAFVEEMRPGWRNAKHAAQWRMTLAKYGKPLRSLPVDTITTADVERVLKPLWSRVPETASRLRGRIEAVLDAASARGLRSGENPARWRGNLKGLLPARQRLTRGHHRAIPWADVPAFMADLRQREGMAALLLEFIVLTAARTGEALGATWREIDLDARVWTVPATRMKAGRAHRVPLSDAALAVLATVRQAREHDGADALVFPGRKRGGPLSNMAAGMLLRRMGRTESVHGFRSTFRDWGSEATGFSSEVLEMALAHVVAGKVERAYRRGDLLEKRRDLMDKWSNFLSPIADNVVPIRAAAM